VVVEFCLFLKANKNSSCLSRILLGEKSAKGDWKAENSSLAEQRPSSSPQNQASIGNGKPDVPFRSRRRFTSNYVDSKCSIAYISRNSADRKNSQNEHCKAS